MLLYTQGQDVVAMERLDAGNAQVWHTPDTYKSSITPVTSCQQI